VRAYNGDLVQLTGEPGIIEQIRHGRVYMDGNIMVSSQDRSVAERKKLMFSGLVSVAIAIDEKGNLVSDAEVMTCGFPSMTRDGKNFDAVITEMAEELLENMPIKKRRDSDAVRQIMERGLRNNISDEWNKKPVCHVLVTLV
jgi:ribonuclease J